MAKLTSYEEVFTRFIEDFRDINGILVYDQAISELAVKGIKSLIVEFNDVYSFDMELATSILSEPEKLFEDFSNVVSSKLKVKDPIYAETHKEIHIRIRGLPSETPLRKIGSDHIGKLVLLHGIIVRASAVTPLIIKAVYRCPLCGELNYVIQDGETLKTPLKCDGCDNKRGFIIVPRESVFIDSQRVTIQERPEDLPPGQLPRSLHIDLKDDLVDNARPGDRITVVGLYNQCVN